MGTVYLARDTALNRPVALKVLLGSLARNPSMVRSFYREAQAAAPLRHPCVVRIYSAGVEAGTPYIAMEYVPGESLDRFLRRTDKVCWQTALYIGAQLAKALECAHAAGVIHRDVKPANILLDRQGRVRLTDFGIARVATLDAIGGAARNVVGTPTYMSPEQCDGAELTPATDLYSLGVVLFQLMSGHPPFRADSPHALAKQILTDDAPRLNRLLPEIPDDVARLVAHLLQKEPGARPRNAAHVVKTIERVQAEEGGKSAVPEALSAFVREQAVESSLRLMTPPPRFGKPAKPSESSAGSGRRTVARTLAIAGIALAIAAGLAFAALGMEGGQAMPAADFTACRFEDGPDGSIRASAVLRGFVFHEVRWADDSLVVEARGSAGTLLDGAIGLLAILPGARRCMSVHAPQGPFALEPQHLTPVPLVYRIPSGDQVPFGNAVLLSHRIEDSARSITQTDLFAQPVTCALPHANPVHRGERASSQNDEAFNAIALHPDGRHLCVVQRDAAGDVVLVERRIGGRSGEPPLGLSIAPAVRALVSGSVQYTPDGEKIAYMRETREAVRELWITPRESGSPGVLLAVGNLDSSYAFSPDGSRVLVSIRDLDTADLELRLLDTATGSVLGRPGRGSVGPEAWLPSADAFVIAQGSPRQAWLVRAEGSFDARAVTRWEHGIRSTPAVSPDGRWIAVIAHRLSDQSIVFIPSRNESAVLAKEAGLRTAGVGEPTLQ
jgi:hypothetical protein